MRGPVQVPVLVQNDQFGQVFTHPAFGEVSVSRINQQAHLFGSQVAHQGYVRVRVSRADLRKDAYGETASGHSAPLFEFDMTEAQWVGLVAGMGGKGMACTLAVLPDGEGGLVRVPALPRPATAEERLDEQVRDTMAQSQAQADAALQRVLKAVEGRLPKAAMADFTRSLEQLCGVGKSNRDYHHSRLAETKDNMVHEARVEIEAVAQGLVRTLGLQSAQQLGAVLANPEAAARLIGPADPAPTA